MKHCLYCLAPFTGRGRCCCPEHARKVTGKVAYVTKSRRGAVRKVMTDLQTRMRFVPKWRQIAMSDDLDPAALAAIFGTEPSPATPRHGDDLDA